MQKKNYFRVLELEERFTFDPADSLEKSYLALQKELRSTSNSVKEDSAIYEKVQLLNKAYHLLKDPVNRAQHLLELSGYTNLSDKSCPGLLMQIVALEEKVENGRTVEVLPLVENMYLDALQQMEEAFNCKDYDSASSHCMGLKYLEKLKQRIYASDNNQ
ncbi:Fe-S protein assembly co-chaperone HscB [Neorickettsia sennetsu]|uniref:Chaperone protein HscB n=1 Tax=Ehrlichia sennetsu (strain ATCC VR-367 / Miyayama) TaxID=222891 RepID=Q2GEA7_EHRS3|nr:Fe-S protein assembly co-chaperone HscB [Neorickettsia sennetsu]ABD46041.1 putative chaperone protein HscB [Neorickettsia sennetsu str. Miyayama]